MLFEQFEDRRLLAMAIDDEYIVLQNQDLFVTPDGVWSNDTIRQWGCVSGEQHDGYTDENGDWHDDPWYECFQDDWVSMSPDDADGVIESGPQHGSIITSLQGARGFTYRPNSNYVGTDSFIYSLTDGENTDYGTITISVNAPPQTNNDSYSANEDIPKTINAPGVLSNDTDANPNDQRYAVLVSNATHGYVYLESNGSFSYYPNSNYYGPDSFTYKANDGHIDGNVATVFLTVDAVNDPPVATNNSFIFVQNIPRMINFVGDDTDGDNPTLYATNVSDPPHGSLTQYLDGTFAYTPDPGYIGNDSFTYRASDGQTTSNLATVSIVVKADGAELLVDLLPGPNGSGSFEKEMLNGTLYFGATGGLWKTDGTAAGTTLVKSVGPVGLTNVNGTLFFMDTTASTAGSFGKPMGRRLARS
jgi:ELWxxDGT repeat protein